MTLLVGGAWDSEAATPGTAQSPSDPPGSIVGVSPQVESKPPPQPGLVWSLPRSDAEPGTSREGGGVALGTPNSNSEPSQARQMPMPSGWEGQAAGGQEPRMLRPDW